MELYVLIAKGLPVSCDRSREALGLIGRRLSCRVGAALGCVDEALVSSAGRDTRRQERGAQLVRKAKA